MPRPTSREPGRTSRRAGELHVRRHGRRSSRASTTDNVADDDDTLTAETSNGSVSSDGDCIDNAGNADTSATFGPVMIDKTAPVIASSAANADASPYVAGTWTNQSVTVSFTCADTGAVQSGIDDRHRRRRRRHPDRRDLERVRQQRRRLHRQRRQRRLSHDGRLGINIDKTAPVVTLAAALPIPSANANGGLEQPGDVAVSFTCADSGSVQSAVDDRHSRRRRGDPQRRRRRWSSSLTAAIASTTPATPPPPAIIGPVASTSTRLRRLSPASSARDPAAQPHAPRTAGTTPISLRSPSPCADSGSVQSGIH